MLTNLNVAAQRVLPDWVRARGLAIYLIVFYGGMTAGSALWGAIAEAQSIEIALLAASSGDIVLGAVVAFTVCLPTAVGDLTPSMHWPEPATAAAVPGERGPVMVTVTYDIDPADRRAFLDAVQRLAAVRRRDGVFGWRIMEDAADPRRFEEVFLAASWLEHLRQHRRITRADADLQASVAAFHRGPASPVVRHALAARPDDDGPPASLGDHVH